MQRLKNLGDLRCYPKEGRRPFGSNELPYLAQLPANKKSDLKLPLTLPCPYMNFLTLLSALVQHNSTEQGFFDVSSKLTVTQDGYTVTENSDYCMVLLTSTLPPYFYAVSIHGLGEKYAVQTISKCTCASSSLKTNWQNICQRLIKC